MPFTSGIGVTELIIVLVIVLVIFGPKRLPQMGKSLGSGMREFKDSISARHKDDDDDVPEITEARADAIEAEGERKHADARLEAERLRAKADALEARSVAPAPDPLEATSVAPAAPEAQRPPAEQRTS